MKKLFTLLMVGLLACTLAGCSASDDDLLGQNAQSASGTVSFALLDYSQSASTPVPKDGSNSSDEMDEKLVCKVLKNGQLLLTHKNVVFDDATTIQLTTTLQGNQMTVTESGAYGASGNYGYYTLTAIVGQLADGDYTIVVKRNDNVRAVFSMNYDSSKAKD